MALSVATKSILGLTVAGALAFLVMSDTGEGVLEYVYVEQLKADTERYAGRTIKVHGYVVEGSIKKKKGTDGDFIFVVQHEGETLPVHYTGEVPDTFQEGGEVVLTGKLEDGTFESNDMSAKCPSKYEEQQAVPTRDDPQS